MAIKKIAKKTLFFMTGFLGLLGMLLVRIFLGGSHIDLSKISSKSLSGDGATSLINTANADTVSGGDSGGGGDNGDCGDSGGGDSY